MRYLLSILLLLATQLRGADNSLGNFIETNAEPASVESDFRFFAVSNSVPYSATAAQIWAGVSVGYGLTNVTESASLVTVSTNLSVGYDLDLNGHAATNVATVWFGALRDTALHRGAAGVISVMNSNQTAYSGVLRAASVIVTNKTYGAGWSADTTVPTRGELYTKIESLSLGAQTPWSGDINADGNSLTNVDTIEMDTLSLIRLRTPPTPLVGLELDWATNHIQTFTTNASFTWTSSGGETSGDWQYFYVTNSAATNITATGPSTYRPNTGSSSTTFTVPAGTAKLVTMLRLGSATHLLDPAVVDTRTGVYRTLRISAGSMIASATNGAAAGTFDATGSDDVEWDSYSFDDTTDEFAQIAFSMPDEWDRGTIKAKFYWGSATATTGDVVWAVQAGALGDDEAPGAILGTAISVTNTVGGTAFDLNITPATAAVTVGGTPALADLLMFRVYRDANNTSDDLSGDAQLLQLVIQYKESDTEPSIW